MTSRVNRIAEFLNCESAHDSRVVGVIKSCKTRKPESGRPVLEMSGFPIYRDLEERKTSTFDR
jgi:hypothetical protein